MNSIIKLLVTIICTLVAFFTGSLRAKNKELERDANEDQESIKNLHENSNINKIVASDSFATLSDGLLKKQKNRVRK